MFRNEQVSYGPRVDKLCLGDNFMYLVLEALIPALSILKSSFISLKGSYFYLLIFFWCVCCKTVKTSCEEPIL